MTWMVVVDSADRRVSGLYPVDVDKMDAFCVWSLEDMLVKVSWLYNFVTQYLTQLFLR